MDGSRNKKVSTREEVEKLSEDRRTDATGILFYLGNFELIVFRIQYSERAREKERSYFIKFADLVHFFSTLLAVVFCWEDDYVAVATVGWMSLIADVSYIYIRFTSIFEYLPAFMEDYSRRFLFRVEWL